MPRHPRIHAPGQWYHVTNRGADRQDIFHADDDRVGFELLLADTSTQFGMEVHATCLMTNHFHLLVHCADDVLSDALHRVSTIYAQRYNRKYERTGPLFEGRFHSTLITDDAQLLQASRYVHRNPVPIVGVMGLSAFRWSTYGCYLGARPTPTWLTTTTLMQLFGSDTERFRQFVERPQPSDAVGGPWSLTSPPALDDIVAAVARAADVDVDSLHRSRHAVVNVPRLVAIHLMVEQRAATAATIAQHFQMSDASTARAAARRARVQLAADAGVRRLYDRARDELRRSA
jgi:REP element-mobilizing transposase RayT